MRYTVPQFIDVEDKIIGPITGRQFLIILVGAMFIFLGYKLFDFTLFVVVALLTVGLVGIIAFLRVNGQPFHYFMLNLLQTIRRPGKRVWDKDISESELREIIKAPPPAPPVVRIRKDAPGARKLSDLSLTVNTGGVYNPEEI